MESDFGPQIAGGGIGDNPAQFFSQYFNWFGGVSWGWVIVIIMLVLIVIVIAMMFGWIGTIAVKNKEGLKPAWSSCLPGNTSPLCDQIRDGAGENLTNSALALGYGANPNVFCKGAGEATTDPWDFLQTTANQKESLAGYANRADMQDFAMTAAGAGY